MDVVKNDKLYVLPGSNLTDTSNTLNFIETSRLSYGHAETVLYFAKKFNLPCRFLKQKEKPTVPFFIDFAKTAKMGVTSQTSPPGWEFYSPIVLEMYEHAMISPLVAAPINAGCVFNSLSFTVS